ncbi:hypothetical protein KUCAC02_006266, partial [Chaenocephalus aceratus]
CCWDQVSHEALQEQRNQWVTVIRSGGSCLRSPLPQKSLYLIDCKAIDMGHPRGDL